MKKERGRTIEQKIPFRYSIEKVVGSNLPEIEARNDPRARLLADDLAADEQIEREHDLFANELGIKSLTDEDIKKLEAELEVIKNLRAKLREKRVAPEPAEEV